MKSSLSEKQLAALEKACLVNKKLLEKRLYLYKLNPKRCKHCNNAISYEYKTNTFCSRSCAAIFNNIAKGPRTQSAKDNISATLTGRKRHGFPKGVPGCTTCVVCKTSFTFKRNGKEFPKTCSMECRKQNRSQIGRRSASKRVLRSKDEIKLFDLCKEIFKNATHNEPLVDGWDADIILPSQKFAILWNGIWHREQLSFKNHSLLQVQTRDRIKIKALTEAGWTVLVYEDNQYTPQTAFDDIVNKATLHKSV